MEFAIFYRIVVLLDMPVKR